MPKQTCKIIDGVEINQSFTTAVKRIEDGSDPLFITGKAGTGKSTLLRYFRLNTKQRLAVVAPTGVAALNVGGQTIHSFFRFSPNVTPAEIRRARRDSKLKKILQKIDILVIDEISMVRADLMDCIDETMRLYLDGGRPFGGKRMVFFGDLHQLPPVVSGQEEKEIFNSVYASPYFFDAKVFHQVKIERMELAKIYRQADKIFIDILNNVRYNCLTEDDLATINRCHQPDSFDSDEGYITLTTTNQAANQINLYKLNQLPGKTKNYTGRLTGEFGERNLPTEKELQLKTGAQVMLLNNDPAGRWVNGSMGLIQEINPADGDQEDDSDVILVKLYDGGTVEVGKFSWGMSRYFFNQATRSLETEEIGTFNQYPIRLAWAVTIHKSQGKTFDRVVIDLGWGAFSPGQVYVALSRCTTLNGLIMKRPLSRRDVMTDQRIVDFMENYQVKQSEKLTPGQKITQIQLAISQQKPVNIIYLNEENYEINLKLRPEKIEELKIGGRLYLTVLGRTTDNSGNQSWLIDRIIKINV